MTELQEYLLKLTLEIDEICTEHDIPYIVCGGGSLGVERNGGFLPWDDDLDIIMTEKNYRRFLKVMQEHPRKDRILESPETNPEYPLHFAKYKSDDSCGLVRALGYGNCHGGIWVDIFYLCPLSKDPATAKSMLEWFQVYCEFQNRRYAENTHYIEGLADKYRKALRRSKIFGYEKTLKWIENKFNFVDDDDCDKYFIHHCLTAAPIVKTYSKKHMEHIVRRPFEGKMLPFSETNPEFCREAYGDSWMMIPDGITQETHDAIYDTSIPYPVVLNDYMQMLDKETIDRELYIYKQTELFYQHDFYDSKRSVVMLQGIVDREELEKRLDEPAIRKLAEERRWVELSEVFREYSELLGKKDFATFDYFPELSNPKMEAYLEMLIRYQGKWSYAEKMMKRFFHLPKETEERLQKLIDSCRAVSVARYDDRDPERLEKAASDLRSWDSDYCKEVDMGLLDFACKRQDHKEIHRLLKEAAPFYPAHTEEMLLAKAMLQVKNGDPAVKETIDTLFETGRNGVLLLDVRKGIYGLQI